MKTADSTLRKVRQAKRESKTIEFKEEFDPNDLQDWCEVIKDIVAIANSGGGYIVFGLGKGAQPSGWDPTPFLGLDPAQITDRIASYTETQFEKFEITETTKNARRLAVLVVGDVPTPMVFSRPGTYPVAGGKQKSAFARGTVYFRHGAKSEPANSQDLRQCIEREVEHIRRSWLGNIRKVVNSPVGHQVKVLPPVVTESSSPAAVPIRIVEDPSAPADRRIDPDRTYPHRQKEIVEVVNQLLVGKKRVIAYDIFCVRRVHKIDQSKPEFYYKSKFASPQYSQAFAEWIVNQFNVDPSFFDHARRAFKRTQ